MLASTRFLLLNTSHPGNIGAAARAMKTMGLEQLYLVQPKEFPSAEATARASGADDAYGNGFAVQELESAGRFDGMSDSMPVVEHSPQVSLEGIGLDDVALNLAVLVSYLFEHIEFSLQDPVKIGFEKIEIVGVGNDGVFH
mgnify:CR=1 FL=1